MTPALKAMVEAMVAEIASQKALDATASPPPPTATVVFVNGVVDVTKVARAALSAPGMIEALTQARPLGWSDTGTYHHLHAMFDAILNGEGK